jgi:hypothetical protein
MGSDTPDLVDDDDPEPCPLAGCGQITLSAGVFDIFAQRPVGH